MCVYIYAPVLVSIRHAEESLSMSVTLLSEGRQEMKERKEKKGKERKGREGGRKEGRKEG